MFFLSDVHIAQQKILLVLLYMLYGIGRCVWESTNKGIFCDYFKNPLDRDMAYAALYFSSGFSGACGYLCYQVRIYILFLSSIFSPFVFFSTQFLNRQSLLLMNFISPILSIATFLLAVCRAKEVERSNLQVNRFTAVLDECFDAEELTGNPIHLPSFDGS